LCERIAFDLLKVLP